jgi:hypothetical protein
MKKELIEAIGLFVVGLSRLISAVTIFLLLIPLSIIAAITGVLFFDLDLIWRGWVWFFTSVCALILFAFAIPYALITRKSKTKWWQDRVTIAQKTGYRCW